MKLKGKVAIVTGGGGSIGGAVCRQFAKEGAAVAVADVGEEEARRVADDIKASGGEAVAAPVDLRDGKSIARMIEGVLETFGKIDILVNSAGGSARGRSAPFHEQVDEVFEFILDVNLLGPMLCTRTVVNHMIERGGGKVVNIGSIVGIQGLVGHAEYTAAKGGIIALTKSLAMELGKHGINVNCVSPGLVPRTEGEIERSAKNSYLGRHCTPENVSDLVTFLCTEEASYITGQNYVIDGGRSLGLKGS